MNLSQFGFLDENRNPENLLKFIWVHIQEQLKFQINYDKIPLVTSANVTSSKEQLAYFEQIHMSFIDFWAHICNLTRANLSTPSGDADQEQSNSTH